MMGFAVNVCVISGADDGTMMTLHSDHSGRLFNAVWTISIGRLESCDVCLTKDSYVSRNHACLHLRSDGWFLQDLASKNGTFLPKPLDFFEDQRVTDERHLEPEQPFRIGRTWLVIKAPDS